MKEELGLMVLVCMICGLYVWICTDFNVHLLVLCTRMAAVDNEMRGYHHDMSLYRGWHRNDARSVTLMMMPVIST